MSNKNILLVEGEADRAFFEALCTRWQLPVQVKVSTPRDAGHTKDTKQAALSVLKTIYLGQLAERLDIPAHVQQVQDSSRLTARFKTALGGLPNLIEQRFFLESEDRWVKLRG